MKKLYSIKSYLLKNIGYIILTFIVGTLNVGLTLYIPILTGKAIDFIIGTNNVLFDNIYPYLIYIAICGVMAAIFYYMYDFLASLVCQNVIKGLRNDVFRKLEKAPIEYIDSHPHGDLVSRCISDIDQISDGLLEGFKQLYRGVITIVFTLAFMISIHYILALVVVFITPLSLFVASFITKKTHQYFTKQSRIKGEIGAYVLEMLDNQKVIKALTYEEDSIKKFESINNELYKVGVNAQFISSTTNPSTRFVNGLVYAAVGIIGSILIINPISLPLTIGYLSSFLSYANQYTKPFNEISGVVSEFQNALSCLERVNEVLSIEPEIDQGNKNLDNSINSINISNVYFSYDKSKDLIKNFNLTVHKGQKIAIVGPTGCGKTTLINLLLRFYDVDSGKISFDNEDIYKYSKSSLRKKYGMVLQDTWIFKGSVYDNVAYSNPNATSEEIEQACRIVHAHSFIKRLPNGYQTIISENSGLSHGEKQLITIARVMLSLPEIVILDEATSSIDTRTEMKIAEAFNKIMEGRTSFVIAHRLSTIKNADLILVMKDGAIIEIGNHLSLLEKKGFYYQLYYSQFADVK